MTGAGSCGGSADREVLRAALLTKLVRGRLVDRRAIGAGPGLRCSRRSGRGRGCFGELLGNRLLLCLLGFDLVELGGAQPLFLGSVLGFLAEQGFAVGLRDLIIIRVNFAEGEKSVTVAPVVDERRLERRFYPGDLGEIDIAFELLVLSGFEVKLLDPVPFDDRDPGLFRVERIDQHAHGH